MLSEGQYFAKYQKCASCNWCEDLSTEGYRKCLHDEETYIAPVKSSCYHYSRDRQYSDKVDYQGNYIGSDSSGYRQSQSGSSGGCYVATAVYGSYDCPEVWALRRYRDNVLAKSFFGRTFIRFYYAVSPTAVKLFGKRKWFNRLFRTPLDRFVKKLIKSGIENTPYEDKVVKAK